MEDFLHVTQQKSIFIKKIAKKGIYPFKIPCLKQEYLYLIILKEPYHWRSNTDLQSVLQPKPVQMFEIVHLTKKKLNFQWCIFTPVMYWSDSNIVHMSSGSEVKT